MLVHYPVIPILEEEATLHADMFCMNPDVMYRPWLVVTKRRNTNKSPKKGRSPDKNMLEGKAKGKLAYPHVWKGPKTPHLVISFRPI